MLIVISTLCGAIGFLLAGCVALILDKVLREKAHSKEMLRFGLILESALAATHTASAVDKAQADTLRKQADIQLKVLEDQLAREQVQSKEQNPDVVPNKVHIARDDGSIEEIDLNQGEWDILA